MKKNPWPFILIGLGLVAVGGIVMLIDIQTTEAVISGATSTPFHPDIAILGQPITLVENGMEAKVGESVLFAWLVWLIMVVFIWAHDIAHELVRSLNHFLPRVLLTAEILSIGFIAVTNYLFAPGTDWKLRLAFTAIMMAAELFCFVLGIHMIDYGIKLMIHGGSPSAKTATAAPKP